MAKKVGEDKSIFSNILASIERATKLPTISLPQLKLNFLDELRGEAERFYLTIDGMGMGEALAYIRKNPPSAEIILFLVYVAEDIEAKKRSTKMLAAKKPKYDKEALDAAIKSGRPLSKIANDFEIAYETVRQRKKKLI